MPNCKVGDLVYFKSTQPEWAKANGHVATVLRRAHVKTGLIFAFGRHWNIPANAVYWIVDPPIFYAGDGKKHDAAHDANLFPMRPDGLTEESVRELYQPSPIKETSR